MSWYSLSRPPQMRGGTPPTGIEQLEIEEPGAPSSEQEDIVVYPSGPRLWLTMASRCVSPSFSTDWYVLPVLPGSRGATHD